MMSLSTCPDPLLIPEAAPLAPRISLSDSVNRIPLLPAASGEILADVISNGAFSKTWILPPRKKPGRKAANNVPPTVSYNVTRLLIVETASPKSSCAKGISRPQGDEGGRIGKGE